MPGKAMISDGCPRHSVSVKGVVLLGRRVLILTYGCILTGGMPGSVQVSSEHRDARLFEIHEMDSLRIPEGYRQSVRTWSSQTMGSIPRGV